MAKSSPSQRPHVVVVGGGFGGIAAVRKLKRADVDVTLIDRHTYNTFQPLLYQVATASLNPGDVTWFLRAIRAKQKNVRFMKGTVLTMDHVNKTLGLESGLTVSYDHLIIAAGVTTNFFGVPGAEEFAMPLYKRSQALAVRDRMFAALENAVINRTDEDLRIVVVGGGATGVETAGAFAELRNNDMPTTYPELDPKRIHITLIEMGPHVLAPVPPQPARVRPQGAGEARRRPAPRDHGQGSPQRRCRDRQGRQGRVPRRPASWCGPVASRHTARSRTGTSRRVAAVAS